MTKADDRLIRVGDAYEYWKQKAQSVIDLNNAKILRNMLDEVPSAQTHRFSRIIIDTDDGWLNRKLDVFKENLYLNERTMVIYVPFVTAELVTSIGGTIERV